MKSRIQPVLTSMRHAHGFTLIEVLVVMVIVGILALSVVFMFASPSARVKTQVFQALGELNMARSEAVSENTEVIVTFLPGSTDGFRIWINENVDPSYNAGVDTLIQQTFFPNKVQFYDMNATGGPNVKPEGGALDVEDGVGDDDNGIVFDSGSVRPDEFVFTPMGTALNSDGNALASTGYIYMYVPESAAEHDKMRAAPYALAVSQTTGSVNIWRWTGATGGWKTK